MDDEIKDNEAINEEENSMLLRCITLAECTRIGFLTMQAM